jgi:hypothetical protein
MAPPPFQPYPPSQPPQPQPIAEEKKLEPKPVEIIETEQVFDLETKNEEPENEPEQEPVNEPQSKRKKKKKK